jgi:hypothetical protein
MIRRCSLLPIISEASLTKQRKPSRRTFSKPQVRYRAAPGAKKITLHMRHAHFLQEIGRALVSRPFSDGLCAETMR